MAVSKGINKIKINHLILIELMKTILNLHSSLINDFKKQQLKNENLLDTVIEFPFKIYMRRHNKLKNKDWELLERNKNNLNSINLYSLNSSVASYVSTNINSDNFYILYFISVRLADGW